MIQVYNPNFNVPATRGWCLKYVDDAGNAPSRKPTAKAAFLEEKKEGRISGDIDSPVGIWAVGFLDFTSGPYTKEGHVFFMKHLGGGRYEIRDSEVGAGARKPYGSLAELIAWFGAYAPKYIGWSTNCDGRQYASEGDDMAKPTEQDVRNIVNEVWGIPANSNNVRDYTELEWPAFVYHILGNQTPWMDRKNLMTNMANQNHILLKQVASLEDEIKKMPQDTSEAEKKLKAIKEALDIK